MKYFDYFNRSITVDWDLCKESNIYNDNWARKGVTPFAVACYVYHALITLNKSPEEVEDAIMNGWDTLVWRFSSIPIVLWNKLFNGDRLSDLEWGKILFPFDYIDSLYTNVTTNKCKRQCHPMFFGRHQDKPGTFMICTEESYHKTVIDGTACKITAYRYGHATGNRDIIQGLRQEVTRVVIPF